MMSALQRRLDENELADDVEEMAIFAHEVRPRLTVEDVGRLRTLAKGWVDVARRADNVLVARFEAASAFTFYEVAQLRSSVGTMRTFIDETSDAWLSNERRAVAKFLSKGEPAQELPRFDWKSVVEVAVDRGTDASMAGGAAIAVGGALTPDSESHAMWLRPGRVSERSNRPFNEFERETLWTTATLDAASVMGEDAWQSTLEQLDGWYPHWRYFRYNLKRSPFPYLHFNVVLPDGVVSVPMSPISFRILDYDEASPHLRKLRVTCVFDSSDGDVGWRRVLECHSRYYGTTGESIDFHTKNTSHVPTAIWAIDVDDVDDDDDTRDSATTRATMSLRVVACRERTACAPPSPVQPPPRSWEPSGSWSPPFVPTTPTYDPCASPDDPPPL